MAITGCYTKVKITDEYRFTKIEGLETVPKYIVEGVPVDRGLKLSQGKTSRVISMDFASNSPITKVLRINKL
jgi:Plus-3 domain